MIKVQGAELDFSVYNPCDMARRAAAGRVLRARCEAAERSGAGEAAQAGAQAGQRELCGAVCEYLEACCGEGAGEALFGGEADAQRCAAALAEFEDAVREKTERYAENAARCAPNTLSGEGAGLLLPEQLPREAEGGEIMPDFRNVLRIQMILNRDDMESDEKLCHALRLLYRRPPADTQKGLRGLLWFYLRGKSTAPAQGAAVLDFEQDAPYIYAAFREAYHVDLARTEFLHWWEFMALLEALPPNVLLCRILYWRSVEMKDVQKHEWDFVLRMRRKYALKRPTGGHRRTVEEINRETEKWAERRFAEARRRLEEMERK